jgi:hypothetical protein
MISIGIIVALAVLYWAGVYALAFWVVVAAIANGLLGTIRSFVDSDWYWKQRQWDLGDDAIWMRVIPHERTKAMASLVIWKVVTIGILAYVGRRFGILAGYFSK